MTAQASLLMSDSSVTKPKPAGSGFPRKVVLLLMLQIVAVLGLYLLFSRGPTPLLGMNLLATLLLGMVAGFSARFALRKRNWFLRFITATASLIVGLYIFGMITSWRVGIGPVVFWNSAIDWIGLGKLSLGITSLLLSMHVWQKRTATPVLSPVSVSAPAPLVAEAPRTARRSKPRPARPKRKPSRQPSFPVLSPKGKPAAAKKVAAKSAAKAVPVDSKKISRPATKPRPSLFHHKPQVHLSKIERHLCPYCLEPVTRNDARGVVECDICHTLHHGDCWAIAGSCQVPHYTAA
jgi:hypothetical protein